MPSSGNPDLQGRPGSRRSHHKPHTAEGLPGHSHGKVGIHDPIAMDSSQPLQNLCLLRIQDSHPHPAAPTSQPSTSSLGFWDFLNLPRRPFLGKAAWGSPLSSSPGGLCWFAGILGRKGLGFVKAPRFHWNPGFNKEENPASLELLKENILEFPGILRPCDRCLFSQHSPLWRQHWDGFEEQGNSLWTWRSSSTCTSHP